MTTLKQETDVRQDFIAHLRELRRERAGMGLTVSAIHEWRLFVDRLASEGVVPPAASRWACPKRPW